MKSVVFLIALLFSNALYSQVVKTEILGVSDENIKKNILASINAQSGSEIPSQKQLADLEAIKKSLQPFGYFKTQVYEETKQSHGKFLVRYYIHLGPKIKIEKLKITLTGEGSSDKEFQKILNHLPLSEGGYFTAKAYNSIKESLLDLALNRGYLDANFSRLLLEVDLKRYVVNIDLNLNTEKRYRFGNIFFNQNPYRDSFLRRYAPFSTGEFYSQQKVQNFQKALSSSTYFKSVLVTPNINQKEKDYVPIQVEVLPLPKVQYNFGVGFGTDSGVRVVANYENHRVTDDGEHFKTQLQLSQVTSNLLSEYVIPGKNPAVDQYILSAATQHIDQDTGKSNLAKAGASAVALSSNGWQRTLGMYLQYEHWALTGNPYQSELFPLFSANWMKLVQDDPVITRNGYRVSITTLGAPPAFGGEPFLQGQAMFKSISEIFGKNQLLLRANLGYTLTENVDRIPLSLQLLAGGTQSIRGYSYNQMGPGTNLLVGSVEYRQHIKDHWFIAVFSDMGNVSNSFPGAIKKTLGVGVVWQSPVGTIELTLAKALDEPTKPNLIQFSLGPEL